MVRLPVIRGFWCIGLVLAAGCAATDAGDAPPRLAVEEPEGQASQTTQLEGPAVDEIRKALEAVATSDVAIRLERSMWGSYVDAVMVVDQATVDGRGLRVIDLTHEYERTTELFADPELGAAYRPLPEDVEVFGAFPPASLFEVASGVRPIVVQVDGTDARVRYESVLSAVEASNRMLGWYHTGVDEPFDDEVLTEIRLLKPLGDRWLPIDLENSPLFSEQVAVDPQAMAGAYGQLLEGPVVPVSSNESEEVYTVQLAGKAVEIALDSEGRPTRFAVEDPTALVRFSFEYEFDTSVLDLAEGRTLSADEIAEALGTSIDCIPSQYLAEIGEDSEVCG